MTTFYLFHFLAIMAELTDYQRTVILYCREFINELRQRDFISMDHDTYDAILLLMLDRGEFGPGMFREVEQYLNDLSGQLLMAYSREPQNTRLDSLYRRAGSLRDMVAGVLNGV
ncbi:MAG: hypothetical protein CVV44_17135 [Spirochaetae bacterium HGW-Spirochaetae-1]|nr:MAG: hypothetical protein CVV44_17135 [Spirochaetae bacterium HGW-Spirochaetae-1]